MTDNLVTFESMMAILSDTQEFDDPSLESAEARMRRALGHFEDNAAAAPRAIGEYVRPRQEVRGAERHAGDRPRARFVQDGDVPVTVLHRSRPHEADAAGPQVPSRLSQAEAALSHERTVRSRAERALAEALSTVHDLQTKWGHAELARQELIGRSQADRAAFEAERAAFQERERSLIEQLAEERSVRAPAESGPRDAATQPRLGRRISVKRDGSAEGEPRPASPVKRMLKTAGPKQREPKPVKWWLGPPKKR